MKILVIGPSWVGDTIMAQTLFITLKKFYNANIHVLAPEWSHPVLARMPEVNKAIVMPIGHGEFGFFKRLNIGKKLRKENYNQAIVLPGSWKSALIPFFAKIPVRTGWLGELRYGLLNDYRRLDKIKYPKMVQRYVALAHAKNNISDNIEIPYPKINIDYENLSNALTRLNLDANKKVLALCAGAAYGPSKCWTIEHFVEVAKEKINSGWDIWLFGSKNDREITNKIENPLLEQGFSAEKIINLAGELDLLETIDLMSTVDAVIANDSGLMHIAASLGRSIIAIYGSTTPKFTPPLSQKAVVLEQNNLDCRPCFERICKFGHYNCMKNTTPDQVLEKLANFE